MVLTEVLTLKARVPFFTGLGEAVGPRLAAAEARAFGFGEELRNRVSRFPWGRSGSSSEESTVFLRRFVAGAIGWGGSGLARHRAI